MAVSPHVAGLLSVLIACALGAVTAQTWQDLMHWAGAPWSGEPARWILVAFWATLGVSFLQTKPIFFVIAAAEAAVTLWCADELLSRKLLNAAESWLGPGRGMAALAVASSTFAYLVYTHPKARTPSVRGVIGLALVICAGLGVTRGWFNGAHWAERLGPGLAAAISGWGQEVSWACVLIVTAVGVTTGRGRPVHLLNAILLLALAYACIKAGYSREVQFPELSTPTKLIKIEHDSYSNVEGWRWAVCVELGCLSAVLIHLSLGMGAISVLFAVVWMIAGQGIYKTVGTLSLARAFGQGTVIGMNGPLTDMGLPPAVGVRSQAADGVANKSAVAAPRDARVEREMARLQRETTVRELGTLVWMLLTAVFAGVIAAGGLRMISEDMTYRGCALFVVWLALLCGVMMLTWVWPRDASQTWSVWLAAFKFSRYHSWLFWLAYGGSVAVSGVWALWRGERSATWTHAAIVAAFLGTATSLVAVAVMTAFGGFPRLPVWVHCVLAAGQSSLAWVLLFHLNPPRSMGLRTKA